MLNVRCFPNRYVTEGLPSHFRHAAHGVVVRLRRLGVPIGQRVLGRGGDGGWHPGDRLRDLFFEETEKDQLPMRSFKFQVSGFKLMSCMGHIGRRGLIVFQVSSLRFQVMMGRRAYGLIEGF